MERQVSEKKPIGLMGHLSTDERSTAFPPEAVHWVGVQQVNELLWGKGYFPQGSSRDRLRRYKATNKPIATSIDAEADGEWNPKLGAYHMIAETLDLHQIDIAPKDRAGIPDLSAVPFITQEMMDKSTRSIIINGSNVYRASSTSGEKKMGKQIEEMTVADISEMPQAVRDAINAEALKAMREQLGVPAGVEVSTFIQEIAKQKEDSAKKLISDRIVETVNNSETGIKIDSVRPTVVELVKAKNPKTVEEVQAAYDQVVESDHIKELLKSVVQETMGPPQRQPIPSQSAPVKGKYFIIPEVKES
jgi:hypothetical protein